MIPKHRFFFLDLGTLDGTCRGREHRPRAQSSAENDPGLFGFRLSGTLLEDPRVCAWCYKRRRRGWFYAEGGLLGVEAGAVPPGAAEEDVRCATGISPRAFSAARIASRNRRCREMTWPVCDGDGSGLVPGRVKRGVSIRVGSEAGASDGTDRLRLPVRAVSRRIWSGVRPG